MRNFFLLTCLGSFSHVYGNNGQGALSLSADTATHHLYNQDGSTWNANNSSSLIQAINSTKGQYAVFGSGSYPPALEDTADLFMIDETSNGTDAIIKHFYKKAGVYYYVYDSGVVTRHSGSVINNNNLTTTLETSWRGTHSYGFSLSSNTLTITDTGSNSLAMTFTAGNIPDLTVNGQGFITISEDTTTHHLYNQDGSTWSATNATDNLVQAIGSTKGQYAISALHSPPLLSDSATLFLIDNASSGTNALLKKFNKASNQNYYVYDTAFQVSANGTIIPNNNLTLQQSSWTGTGSFSFSFSPNALTLLDSDSNTLSMNYTSSSALVNIQPILGWSEPDITYTISNYGIHTSYSQSYGQALYDAFALENKNNYVVFGDLGLGLGEDSSFYPQIARTVSSSVTDSISSLPSYNFIGDPGSTHSVSYTNTLSQSVTISITDDVSDFSVVTSDAWEELYNNLMPLKTGKKAPNGDDLSTQSLFNNSATTFPLPAFHSPSNYPSSSSRSLPGFHPIPTSPYSSGRGIPGCTIPILLENLKKYYIYTCSLNNYTTGATISFRFQIMDSCLKSVLKKGFLNVVL